MTRYVLEDELPQIEDSSGSFPRGGVLYQSLVAEGKLFSLAKAVWAKPELASANEAATGCH